MARRDPIASADAYQKVYRIDLRSGAADRRLFNIYNLAGLRSGNHVLKVGVFVDRTVRINPLFVFAFDSPLLFVLLLLLSRLLSAAFFQLVFLSSWLKF
jgi:hypothetical protein